MEELIKIISGTVLGGFLGYFIRLFIEHRLAIDRIKENIKLTEDFRAASKFRSFVLYELVGFYPIDQYWEEKEFPRLYQSIPRIKSAAAEFRFFVKSKDAFDSSVKDYDEYCRKTTYQAVTAYAMCKNSMYKPDDKGPREEFKNIVEHLLSFANEK
jgi:hypothetical protein